MNEYLTYAAIAVGVMLIALLIPGLKVMAEGVLGGVFALLGALLKHGGTFAVWAIKTMSGDHLRILRHALTRRDEVDPTQRIRRRAEGYED